MSVLHAPRRPEVDRRLYWFPLCILPLMAVLGGRIWYYQVYASPQLLDDATKIGKSVVPKLAPRGTIYDRRGKIIAGVKGQLVVTIKPSVAKKHKEILEKLAQYLQLSVQDLQDTIDDDAIGDRPVSLKSGISIETATKISESPDLEGVEIDEKPMRSYSNTKDFTHVLGYVWTPSAKDVDRMSAQNLKAADYVGKLGVERTYEAELMGVPGKDITEGTKKQKFETEEPAVPGKQLHLSIDAGLQEYAQDILRKDGFKGAVAAIDPQTGEVLALVSNPTYDVSPFLTGISSAQYKALQDDPAKPQIFRAIAGGYAPGSTFKILTSIAAYRAGILKPSTTYYCDGAYHFTAKAKLRCLGNHGYIGYTDALTKSCNTYFSTLAVNTGKEELTKAAVDCGFGSPTGLDLVGEAKGIVPTEEWLARDPKHRPFYKGNLAQFGIGQGYINATPIQMANLAALVANRGIQYKPHTLHAIRDSITQQTTYIKPEISHRIQAEDWFWDMLQNALCNVVDHGTAAKAKIDGMEWGGKTGSAEHGVRAEGLTHSWFVGFAPKKNPKIAICVIAEAVGHGGDFAAPIAGSIVKHYLFTDSKTLAKAPASATGSKPAGSATPVR